MTRARLKALLEAVLLLLAGFAAALMGVVLVVLVLFFYAALFTGFILAFAWVMRTSWQYIFS